MLRHRRPLSQVVFRCQCTSHFPEWTTHHTRVRSVRDVARVVSDWGSAWVTDSARTGGASSAIMFPLTVMSRSAMSYPPFVARSVNRPALSPFTQYWPALSLVVDSEVSFTRTVAPPTSTLPVSSFTVPQTLNAFGVGAGVSGKGGTFSDLVAVFAPTESV